jgi:hypothetical protein
MANYLFDLPNDLIEVIYEKKHRAEMKNLMKQLPEYKNQYEDEEMANEVFEGASYIWKLKKKIRDNKY